MKIKCNIKKLDKRFSYHEHFDWVIEFGCDMAKFRGPENYIVLTEALREAYDPSTNITIWKTIYDWNYHKQMVGLENNEDSLRFCNRNWAFTALEHDNRLKIYLKEHVLSWLLVKFDLENEL